RRMVSAQGDRRRGLFRIYGRLRYVGTGIYPFRKCIGESDRSDSGQPRKRSIYQDDARSSDQLFVRKSSPSGGGGVLSAANGQYPPGLLHQQSTRRIRGHGTTGRYLL